MATLLRPEIEAYGIVEFDGDLWVACNGSTGLVK
jgi:hypothetical protein